MKKKILAVFLSLCMAMSLLPVTALATGDGETETQTPTESSITTEKALKEAIENTQAGGTVTLDEDIAITAPVVINKRIILDLNEKKIYAKESIWNEDAGRWSLISVGEGGDLIVTGNGTLQAKKDDTYAIDVNGGSCTIENGTFVGNVHAVYVLQGTLVVKDGTFSVQQKYSEAQPYEFVLNCYDASYNDGSAKITVYGGSFKGFNPRDCEAEGVGTNFCAPGYVVEKNQGTDPDTYTVKKLDEGSMAVIPEHSSKGSVSASLEGTFTSRTETIQGGGTEGEPSGTVTGSDVSVNLTTKNGNSSTASLNVATDTADSLADNANSLTVKSDVGTVSLNKAALSKLENVESAVVISIEEKDAAEGAAPTWEVTVKEGEKELFAETTDVGITITVPAPTGASDNTKVYCIDDGMEDMSATYNDSNKTLEWTTKHLSTFAAITLKEGDVATWTTGSNSGSGDLAAALNAVKDSGGTITLLDNAKLEGANNYTIKGDVTIQGNYTITATPAAGQRTKVFTIENGGKLTLNGVTLNMTGTKNSSDNKKEGDGINVRYGAELVLKDATVTFTDMFSPLVFEASPNITTLGKLTMENSTITATGTRGNFSNGGEWAIKEGSTVNIKDCGTHGLSVEKLTVDKSNVTVDGAKWVGIYASEMSFTNRANVTVTNCATAEGISGAYKDKGAVQLKHVGDETPELKIEDSTLTLKDNGNAANGQQVIYVGEGTLENTGTINADKVDMAGADEFNITLVNNGDKSFAVTTSKSYTLPDYPNQGNNHFQGWRDQDGKTYEGGAKVENITKDMTFTAVWSYIPPANPNYRIDIPDFENGTVTADPTAAKAGATVTLTATPDEGYAVGTIIVTDRFGDAVKVTEQADGTYTFTMPNGQVTVKATFVETEEPAPAMPFTDVKEGDWFYDEVLYVYENGLMNGVGDNRFAPNSATTRGMLVTILYRLEGEPAVTGEANFSDVAAGQWYTDAVIWAAANDIVNGIGDNQFGPENTLTREQLVTMLYRYAQNKGYDVTASADLSGYPDAGQIQSWAQEAMTWAVAEGIVEGMDGNLNPAGHATRAQIATILMRFCEGVAK